MSECVAIELARREFVYLMSPREFCFEPCKYCGHEDLMWSEFKGRVWCPICRVDYRPDFFGIIDGPVPVNTCMMMGFSFDTFDLTTQQVVEWECPTWPLSPVNPKAELRET
jgi:hypothetical protein